LNGNTSAILVEFLNALDSLTCPNNPPTIASAL
jgi:hypothetical protein